MSTDPTKTTKSFHRSCKSVYLFQCCAIDIPAENHIAAIFDFIYTKSTPTSSKSVIFSHIDFDFVSLGFKAIRCVPGRTEI